MTTLLDELMTQASPVEGALALPSGERIQWSHGAVTLWGAGNTPKVTVDGRTQIQLSQFRRARVPWFKALGSQVWLHVKIRASSEDRIDLCAVMPDDAYLEGIPKLDGEGTVVDRASLVTLLHALVSAEVFTPRAMNLDVQAASSLPVIDAPHSVVEPPEEVPQSATAARSGGMDVVWRHAGRLVRSKFFRPVGLVLVTLGAVWLLATRTSMLIDAWRMASGAIALMLTLMLVPWWSERPEFGDDKGDWLVFVGLFFVVPTLLGGWLIDTLIVRWCKGVAHHAMLCDGPEGREVAVLYAFDRSSKSKGKTLAQYRLRRVQYAMADGHVMSQDNLVIKHDWLATRDAGALAMCRPGTQTLTYAGEPATHKVGPPISLRAKPLTPVYTLGTWALDGERYQVVIEDQHKVFVEQSNTDAGTRSRIRLE